MLNKEDFTEDVWAAITAEIDRERTRASNTARTNAEKEFSKKVEAEIAAALEAERQRLEMSEQEKLEAERKKLEAEAKALAADKKGLAATKKLLGAGIPEDTLDSLLPLFTHLDDATFDTSLSAFIELNQNLVKTQVDATKQQLLQGATPPAAGSNPPVDAQTAAAEALTAGQPALAVDILLKQSGLAAL